jgi:hypothetical protein
MFEKLYQSSRLLLLYIKVNLWSVKCIWIILRIWKSEWLSRYSDGLLSRQGQDFSLLYSVQTGPGAHPMCTEGSYPEDKAAEAWSWPFTSICAEIKNGGAIPQLPHMSSWRSAQGQLTSIVNNSQVLPRRKHCVSITKTNRLLLFIVRIIRNAESLIIKRLIDLVMTTTVGWNGRDWRKLHNDELYNLYPIKLNSVVLVRKRTIPTERPPNVGEVSANICG